MPRKSPKETAAKRIKLSQQLTQIYQDNEGRLPDMKRIKIKKSHPGLNAFLVIIFLGGLLAAAAWAGFLLMPGGKKFSEERISLNIEGPKEIVAGSTTTYKISFANNQSLAMRQATLNVQYPEGFVFLSSDLEAKNTGHTEWDLNEIGARERGEINITGLTYGSLDKKQSWRVFLTYQPENFSSELQKATVLDVPAAKSPFSLTISGPAKAVLGNAAEYVFTLKKEFASRINKLELKPSWPKNFLITSSSPALNKDRKWIIEPDKTGATTSSVADSWTFKLTGKFSPAGDGAISVGEISGALAAISNSDVFVLAEAKNNTELTQNDLDFNLAINGSMTNFNSQPGDTLNITLSLKNLSAEDLTNATLKLILDAPSANRQSLLNWPKITDKFDGDIRGIQINDDLRRGEITWNKNKIPSLAKIGKNQEVSLDIQLPIKDRASADLSDFKGSKITVLAEINFRDANNVSRAYAGNQIIITVNSDLKFEARDTVSGAGDGEKHKVDWVLTNSFHPLKNLTLTADVYGDIQVELPSAAPAGEIKFDPASKKITWLIPAMPETVDVLALPFIITLNKINPTQELLVSRVHIQAEDTTTGEKLNFMGEEVGLNRP